MRFWTIAVKQKAAVYTLFENGKFEKLDSSGWTQTLQYTINRDFDGAVLFYSKREEVILLRSSRRLAQEANYYEKYDIKSGYWSTSNSTEFINYLMADEIAEMDLLGG